MLECHALTFGRLHTWTLSFFYEKSADRLTIRAPWRGAGAVWVDLPDGVRVKADPQTGEVVEFQIERLMSSFLPARPDLSPLWGQVKPTPVALRRMENTPFIERFLEHMERLAYDREKLIDPRAAR